MKNFVQKIFQGSLLYIFLYYACLFVLCFLGKIEIRTIVRIHVVYGIVVNAMLIELLNYFVSEKKTDNLSIAFLRHALITMGILYSFFFVFCSLGWLEFKIFVDSIELHAFIILFSLISSVTDKLWHYLWK